MFQHLRMNLAHKKILGQFTKVLGIGKTPPIWEKFPNNPVIFFEWVPKQVSSLQVRYSESVKYLHKLVFHSFLNILYTASTVQPKKGQTEKHYFNTLRFRYLTAPGIVIFPLGCTFSSSFVFLDFKFTSFLKFETHLIVGRHLLQFNSQYCSTDVRLIMFR